MANIPLKSIKFPDLADTYTVPSNAGELPYNKSDTYPADTVGKALQNIGDSSAPAIIETVQGSIASFDDGADNIPVKDLVAEIVPLQSGSGDPSPSNVRAISGWTEANITVCGINLFNKNDIYKDNYYLQQDGSETSNGTYCISNYIKVLPNTTYHLENTAGSSPAFCWYDENQTYISGVMNVSGTSKDITSPANAMYLKASVLKANLDTFCVNVSDPSIDGQVIPYNGNAVTISFGQTVYGGRLDVTSGVLTVDREIADLGDLSWQYITTSDRNYFVSGSLTDRKIGDDMICTEYKYGGNSSDSAMGDKANFTLWGDNGGVAIKLKNSSYTDAWTFKNAMVGVKLVYPLATPTTYQLTPTEVKTLLKNNNIWADTGDVTVEYVADTKTFIEELINA